MDFGRYEFYIYVYCLYYVLELFFCGLEGGGELYVIVGFIFVGFCFFLFVYIYDVS